MWGVQKNNKTLLFTDFAYGSIYFHAVSSCLFAQHIINKELST